MQGPITSHPCNAEGKTVVLCKTKKMWKSVTQNERCLRGETKVFLSSLSFSFSLFPSTQVWTDAELFWERASCLNPRTEYHKERERESEGGSNEEKMERMSKTDVQFRRLEERERQHFTVLQWNLMVWLSLLDKLSSLSVLETLCQCATSSVAHLSQIAHSLLLTGTVLKKS